MTPSASARAQLEKRVRSSKRGSSVQFPTGFVRDPDTWHPPAAEMLRSGTLKTFLVLMMAATKAPHDITIAPSELAEILDMPDPLGSGKRRVSDALRRLGKQKALRRDLRPGRTTATTILDPAGSGDPWNSKDLRAPYLSIPIGFWSNAWILTLSSAATSVLIALCDLTQSRADSTGFASGTRKGEYGLSAATWTRGTKELVGAGVISVETKMVPYHGEPRRRLHYTLDRGTLSSAP